jgi:galactose mutarotase-like enzyme
MITLSDGNARVTIASERGAIVSRFDIGDHRILFMDESTLIDPTKNVRGGVPILFPSPGKLTNDTWSRDGLHGVMKQHGFARNLGWHRVGGSTLSLESNKVTREQYPWDFVFDMAFSLHGTTLRLEQRITNRSSTPMPFGVGFHPYFEVRDADKRKARITTTARHAFDNVTKKNVELDGIDLAQKEVDLHLLDHGKTECSLVHAGGTVLVRGSKEYTHWVVWTLAGRDFVCLEPWTCPGDALNSGDRLMLLDPGQSRELWLEISASH